MVGAIVLIVLSLTAVIIIVVVLGRRALKRRAEHTERRGISLEKNSPIKETEDGKEKTYDVVVCDRSSAKEAEALYQELVGPQQYASVYAQLRGGTYQELDPHSREEEHQYQSAYRGKEGHGRRK